MGFMLFIFFVMAVIQLLFPAKMLMLGRRWQFKEGAEPSDVAIMMARIVAIIGIVIVIVVSLKSL